MDNVIRSASMKQRQRVTQKQCRHTHTHAHVTRTQSHITRTQANTLLLLLSLALSKNESVKRGPQQSQFLWQMFTHFICTGVGAQRLCFTTILQPFQSYCFSFTEIINNAIISSRTHTHTHTRTQHTRARLGKGEGKNENQLGDEWPSITKYTMAENTEKEENLQKPKPANENARLHQFRIIT